MIRADTQQSSEAFADSIAEPRPQAPLRPTAGRLDRWLAAINSISHMLAAFWLFAIAGLICADVTARALFNAPLSGTAEIVANSVVSIVFLQLPSAVRSGGMLRAEILDAYLPARILSALHAVGYYLGAALFLAVAWSAWGPMTEAWTIGEYAGNESTVEIPLAPVRTLLVAMSVLAAINFALMALERRSEAHGEEECNG